MANGHHFFKVKYLKCILVWSHLIDGLAWYRVASTLQTGKVAPHCLLCAMLLLRHIISLWFLILCITVFFFLKAFFKRKIPSDLNFLRLCFCKNLTLFLWAFSSLFQKYVLQFSEMFLYYFFDHFLTSV